VDPLAIALIEKAPKRRVPSMLMLRTCAVGCWLIRYPLGQS
jgi:hypothetical protein